MPWWKLCLCPRRPKNIKSYKGRFPEHSTQRRITSLILTTRQDGALNFVITGKYWFFRGSVFRIFMNYVRKDPTAWAHQRAPPLFQLPLNFNHRWGAVSCQVENMFCCCSLYLTLCSCCCFCVCVLFLHYLWRRMNRPPQNISPGHKDYFDLEGLERQEMKFSCERHPLCSRNKVIFFSPRTRSWDQEYSTQAGLLKWFLSSFSRPTRYSVTSTPP